MADPIPVLVAAGATALALPVVLAGLKRLGIQDTPNARSSHNQVAVRGLGIACLVGWLVAIPFTMDAPNGLRWALLVGPVVIAGVGIVDDLRGGLGPTQRLVLTLVFAAVTAFGVSDAADVSIAVWVPLGAIWIAYFTNAFNFMDGIDGISAAAVVVAGSAYAWTAGRIGAPLLVELGLVLAACALAFGALNVLGTGRFLGDAGSYFFGSAIATLALAVFLVGASAAAAAGPLVLYVADTVVAFVRRARRRETLTEAHREHAYQRLVDGGLSHATTVILVVGVMLVTAGIGRWTIDRSTPEQVAAALVMLLVTCSYLVTPGVLTKPARRERE